MKIKYKKTSVIIFSLNSLPKMCSCKDKIINSIKEHNEYISTYLISDPKDITKFIIEIPKFYKINIPIDTFEHRFQLEVRDWKTDRQITIEEIGYNNDQKIPSYRNFIEKKMYPYTDFAKGIVDLYEYLLGKTNTMV